jgi:hypothetical protein
MPSREDRLDFDDYDGTPGKQWDDFDARLKNYAAGRTDDRGYSVADHLLKVDEGSPGVPMPVGAPTELRKAQAARRRRQKESYAILTKHIARCTDHLKYIHENHFQDGQAAYDYLEAASQAPLNAIRTRELRRLWDDMDLMELVGVQEHSIQILATKVQAQNAEFPAPSRKDRSECAERILEMILDTSKHFAEQATDEYNSAVGNRRFEHAGHAIHGNHRDLDAMVLYYDQQWSAAFNSKLPGFEPKPPTKRPRATGQVGRESPARERGNVAGEYEPNPGSPAHTIDEIANAGLEIAQHRGTVTTSDWSMLDRESLCALAEDGGIEGEAELGLIFDADDVASIEIICDCCRGLGHPRARCPSNRNRYRSLAYAIGILQAKLDSIKNNPSRRQPGRGQRPPFRANPRRFEPRGQYPRGPGGFPRPGSLGSASSRSSGPPFRPRQTGRTLEEGEIENDASSTSSDRESLSTARESAQRTRESTPEANSTGGHLTAQGRGGFQESKPKEEGRSAASAGIDLEDDSLFERGWVATETRESADIGITNRMAISSATILCAIACSILAFTVAVWEHIGRPTGTALILIAISIGLVPLARAEARETALVAGGAREYGMIALNHAQLPPACVDSGATTTSIPLRFKHLLKEITNSSPTQKLYIADDHGLRIDSIGKMDLPVSGWIKDKSGKKVHVDDILESSRTFVVDGLGQDTFLMSVRGMKRDKINAYFNDG